MEEDGEKVATATARSPGPSKRGTEGMHRGKQMGEQFQFGGSLSLVCVAQRITEIGLGILKGIILGSLQGQQILTNFLTS